MTNMKKYFSVLVLFLLSLFAFCGCGASIDTKMEVDKEFMGTRTISVTVEKSDLDEYVTGGVEALKQVADVSIPKEMSYSVSTGEETTVMTFQVEFENVADYVEKVNNIISAGSNQDLKPEVQYENMDTLFKKGVYFSENFTSQDLLQWYFDALNEAQIISETDQSNWASLGGSQCIIDGKEYEVYSELYVDEQDNCCLDTFEVETTLHIDGTITREFRMGAYNATLEKLMERGCVFADYVKELVAEGATIASGDNADDEGNYEEYIITVTAKNTEELTKKTNQILQSENEFTLEIKENEETTGMAKVYVTEKLDGSYYLDYRNGNPLTSTVNTYANSSIAVESVVLSDETVYFVEDQLVYTPLNTRVQEFIFDWKIGFATIELDIDIKSRGKKADVCFIFTPEDTLDDKLQQQAIQSLKKSCGKYGKFEEHDGKCFLSFTGPMQEVCQNINELIKLNDTEAEENVNYFNIKVVASERQKMLFNCFNAEIYYNLSPIVGRQLITLCDGEKFYKQMYYNGDFIQDSDGEHVTLSEATVTTTQSKISIAIVVACGVGVLLFLLGSIMLAFNMKKIKKNPSERKEHRKKQQELNDVVKTLEIDGDRSKQDINDDENTEDDLL